MQPPRGTRPAQAGMCRGMTSQHVALMDEMMLATMGNQGGMGNGMGRGTGMGGGMMGK